MTVLFFVQNAIRKGIKLNNNNSLSLPFLVDQDDGWPPIPIEHIRVEWLKNDDYKILVAPFFISEMSVGDVISVKDKLEGNVASWISKDKSKRSTIWILCHDFSAINQELEHMKKNLCNIERLTDLSLVTIDVPESYSPDMLEESLARIEEKGGSVACPSCRH